MAARPPDEDRSARKARVHPRSGGAHAPQRTIHGAWVDDPEAVTFIDAHHHLWDLRNAYPWLTDEPFEDFFLGSYDRLKADYGPREDRDDARRHNVLATVHCEAEWDRRDPVGETRWLSAVHAACGFPNAIVAYAPFQTDDAGGIVAEQASFPLVRGIRSKPVTAHAPGALAPGAPGTMQDERWLRGFSALARHGLSWDLRVPFWHLEEAAAVARSFPTVAIVLNHTGLPWDRSTAGLAEWRRVMGVIAREPNVHLKVSEFGLKDKPWTFEENAAIVNDAVAIFGIDRCMFATNFPVAGLRIGYDALVRSVKRMISHLSAEDQDKFFWMNAASFYRIDLERA